MIKKISALVIALVLCLSVVVMPVNAAVELGDADIAFALEWDKASYSAGDTAVLSVYMDAADDLSLFTGSFIIGLNSAVISQADNAIDDVKANSTTADWFATYYKGADTQLSWLTSTVAANVTAANTTEEQGLYDHYLKYTVNRNTSGSHPNCNATKEGFGGDEFIANEPIITVSFKIASDVADGTAVRAAITSGSTSCKPVQTTWKYYKTPGTATTTTNLTATQVQAGIPQADTTVANGGTDVTIGATTIVNPLKGQMRYGATAGTYDVRALAVITGADFTATFGSIADAKTKIKDIGFVFASGSNITAPSMEAVAALVEKGTAITGYKKVPISQISTAIQTGDYVFSCIVKDIPAAAAQSDKLIAIGYVAWDSDADGVVDSYNYYTEAQTINFADYYKA